MPGYSGEHHLLPEVPDHHSEEAAARFLPARVQDSPVVAAPDTPEVAAAPEEVADKQADYPEGAAAAPEGAAVPEAAGSPEEAADKRAGYPEAETLPHSAPAKDHPDTADTPARLRFARATHDRKTCPHCRFWSAYLPARQTQTRHH